ncbi:MAG: MarR family winged helix-turn-helix transcriptional regulator [Bacillota bacterium]
MNSIDLNIVVRNLLEIFPPLIKRIKRVDLMKESEITPSSFRILNILYYHDNLTLSDISRLNTMSSSNCSRAVDELTDLGYTSRKRDKEDKRKTRISLTTQGTNYVEEAHNKIAAELKKHLSVLDPEDLRILQDSSRKIHSVLSKLNSIEENE